MKIPNAHQQPRTPSLSLARIVSEDSQRVPVAKSNEHKSSKDS